ncbi:hypothetical protein GCM10009609_55860 [Pseudonocardia aurantiaca]
MQVQSAAPGRPSAPSSSRDGHNDANREDNQGRASFPPGRVVAVVAEVVGDLALQTMRHEGARGPAPTLALREVPPLALWSQTHVRANAVRPADKGCRE